jgi:hypothetical protein
MLEDADTGPPFFVLILFYVKTFSSCATRQLANYCLQWITQETFAIFDVPGGTRTHALTFFQVHGLGQTANLVEQDLCA